MYTLARAAQHIRRLGEIPLDRTHFSPEGKPDHRAPRIARGSDDFHDHGLRRNRESADSFGERDGGRRRAVRHLHFVRGGHARYGTLGELSDCPCTGNVVERLFHLFDCSWPRGAVENCARSGISLWSSFSIAYAE